MHELHTQRLTHRHTHRLTHRHTQTHKQTHKQTHSARAHTHTDTHAGTPHPHTCRERMDICVRDGECSARLASILLASICRISFSRLGRPRYRQGTHELQPLCKCAAAANHPRKQRREGPVGFAAAGVGPRFKKLELFNVVTRPWG